MSLNPSINAFREGGGFSDCPYPTGDFDSIVIGIPPQSPIPIINQPSTGCSSEFIIIDNIKLFHQPHHHNHNKLFVHRGVNQRYGNMEFDDIENSLFDDLSSGASSINPSPRVNQPSDSRLSYRVVIEPESPICLHQVETPIIGKESNSQPFSTVDQSQALPCSHLEEIQDKLIKDLLKDEFKIPIFENNSNTVNYDNVNNKTKRPTPSLRTLKQPNPATKNNQSNLQKAINQRIHFSRTLTSKRSGSAPLSRPITNTPEPKSNNVIKNLEKAMDTLYSTQRKPENPRPGSTQPFFNNNSLEKQVEQLIENQTRKKSTLKIFIDNSNNVEYVRDRKKVKYEGMKTYNSNKKNIDSFPEMPPKRVDSEKLISSQTSSLTTWDKLKLGTANLKKRIESMKSSLQRCGSQLRVEKILGSVSSNNLLVASTSSSSKLIPPTIEYRRSSTKRELTKQKGISPDLFNENSILCQMFNLLSEINNKDKVKIKWTLKKKYKVMIAQEKARKKEANLKGIYEHRKRLTRFQLQAVLNTVHPARIAPEIEAAQIPPKNKNSLTPSNSTLRSASPNLVDTTRTSSNLLEYHEKNKEDILKQLNIIEHLNSTLFSNDVSRKVKFGNQKSNNKNDSNSQHCERRQSIVSNSEISETLQQAKISRPQSAPSKKQSEPTLQTKKWNLQDVMIEKELSKQKKKIPKPKKSLYALATTFSETKLKLFNPYSPNVKENSENYSQHDQTRKNKSKGNSLVTEFQKMVLEENTSSSGLNRSAMSEIDEAPRDTYDFSTVNPFDAVKNLNLTKQPASMSEMLSISTNLPNNSAEESHHKEENASYKKKPKLKPPLDTGLRKVKKDQKVDIGLVCTTGNFTLS
ncbi:predicted protein [Naegleria gruberi]|uniref:Predicted protein n=1 Tax=Naegleria gruberi TaxID=5762 RepID=D2UXK9_NAEGR|nr:uncharacterized protein NAEGRDRAFT_61162 [Naegleria gruberi]EFC50652.1 predicted protein [Naegleria gruberi]|eukprot:XP_002683396.1 predicted protein [Naegleria gruberi strain NEG-M]